MQFYLVTLRRIAIDLQHLAGNAGSAGEVFERIILPGTHWPCQRVNPARRCLACQFLNCRQPPRCMGVVSQGERNH